MIDLPNSEDDDDFAIPATDTRADQGPIRRSAASVLATLAIDGALDKKSSALLARPPHLLVIRVPDDGWADIIAEACMARSPTAIVRTVTRTSRAGSRAGKSGVDELRWLQSGRNTVFVCPDPEGLLDETVLLSADLIVKVASLTPELIRKTIRLVTGGVARGVTQHMSRLDINVVTCAIRPGLSAGQCIDNLRRAVERQPSRRASSGPALSDLALTGPVREWSDQVTAELEAVDAGRLAPDQLSYCVLEGPPGTGKSLVAEALARSAGWTFVPTSVGRWFTVGDGTLGSVSRSLKAFFDSLVEQAPAVGLLDELDALPDRSSLDARSREWWTTVITLALTEIDRIKRSNEKVMLIGATNYYNRLDAALVRPGRLEQRVSVQPPGTEQEVVALLRACLGQDLIDHELQGLARFGLGATPATVSGWVRDARAFALSRNRPLCLDDLVAQMAPRDDRSAEDQRAVALHEAGHAVVAHRLGQTVARVSLVPDGNAGGSTETRRSSLVPSFQQICDDVTVALAGRAADIVVGDGANAGAENDLLQATGQLRAAIERQGLGKSLAYVFGNDTASTETSKTVEEWLQRLLQRAIGLIEGDRDGVLGLAERLVAQRVLTGREVVAVISAKPSPAPLGKAQRADRGARHSGRM